MSSNEEKYPLGFKATKNKKTNYRDGRMFSTLFRPE